MTPNSQPDDWRPAAAGEVGRLVRHMKGRKTRRQFLRAGVLGGLVAAVGGWWAVRRDREYDFGGITCSQVAARADDFRHGRLPPGEAAQVRAHVAVCPHCKPMFEQMGGHAGGPPGCRSERV